VGAHDPHAGPTTYATGVRYIPSSSHPANTPLLGAEAVLGIPPAFLCSPSPGGVAYVLSLSQPGGAGSSQALQWLTAVCCGRRAHTNLSSAQHTQCAAWALHATIHCLWGARIFPRRRRATHSPHTTVSSSSSADLAARTPLHSTTRVHAGARLNECWRVAADGGGGGGGRGRGHLGNVTRAPRCRARRRGDIRSRHTVRAAMRVDPRSRDGVAGANTKRGDGGCGGGRR
jgi:hypothetical protein